MLGLVVSGLGRAFFRYRVEERGSSAIEFAIIAPVFLLMLFGMLAYAIYFGAAHSVQQLAADAARTSIAGLSAAERDSLVEAFIDNNAGDYLLLDPSQIAYEVGDKEEDTNQYRVTVSYNASQLPIWNLYVPLPLPDQTIRFTSTIRLGGI
jgi:Flp pilus assembly protein TadG